MPQQNGWTPVAEPKGWTLLEPAKTEPERTWGDTALDVAKGIGKGAIHSGIDLAAMAAQSGMLPGLTSTSLPPQVTEHARDLTPYRNDPQKVGGAIETAAELFSPAKSAGSLALKTPGTLVNIAELAGVPGASLVRRGLQVARMLPKATPAAVEAAAPTGRLVGAKLRPIEQELADALTQAPKAMPSVELPPPPKLPAGYTPRTSAPPSVTPPLPESPPQLGRLVGARVKPSVEQEMADAISEVRNAPAAPRITTPPPPELPPGYKPRTSTMGPRNYFLKTDAVTPPEAPPKSASVSMSDLPESWKPMTAPSSIAPRDIGGSELAGSYAQELIRRGVKPAQALKAVRNNPDLPPDVKTQIMTALIKVAHNQ
jgi:hypothetical protein